MKCLVTGAAGFVGSSLSERLLEQGHRVVAIDCFTDYYSRELKESNLKQLVEKPGFEFTETSLKDANLSEILDGVEWVFHQAGQAGVRASWGQSFDNYIVNNIDATQYLLESLKGSHSLKKLVYASSSSVYGDAESYPTLESILPKPVSPYGVTKLAAEHLVNLYASQYGIPTVSLRYFTVFGPRQRPDMAFNRFIKAALAGEAITVYGDGNQSRDFTFISDILDANIAAAEIESSGEVFNIGGGTRATINQVLEILGSHFGTLNINREERQLGDARHTSADTSAARDKLDFKPKVSLEEGLNKQIEWMSSF